MRELIRSLVSSSWHASMVGVDQITKSMSRPMTRVLEGQGGSLKAVAAAADRQIDNALKATATVGDDVQQRTLDLFFDFLTLKPLTKPLENRGLLGSPKGYQRQPELEYLEVMNDAGPAPISLPVIVLAVMYANLNKEKEGIARFERYYDN